MGPLCKHGIALKSKEHRIRLYYCSIPILSSSRYEVEVKAHTRKTEFSEKREVYIRRRKKLPFSKSETAN